MLFRQFILISFISLGSYGFSLRPAERVRSITCSPFLVEVSKILWSFSKQQRSWYSVPSEAMRFALFHKIRRPDRYLLGYTEDDLKKAGIQFHYCSNSERLYKVFGADSIFETDAEEGEEETLTQVRVPPGFNGSGSSGSQIKLIDSTNLLLIVSPYQLPHEEDHFLEYFKSPLEFSQWLIHELFHEYQAQKSVWNHLTFELEDRDLTECAQNQAWLSELELEILSWQDLYLNYEKMTDQDLQEKTIRILDLREGSHFLTSCWKRVEFGEFFEGTAQYFSASISKAAKQNFNAMALWPEGLSNRNRNIFKTGREMFYFTGLMICQTLTRLTKSLDWQKNMEKGQYPAEVLRNLYVQ